MDDVGSLNNAPKNNTWKWPLLIFFKDASLVFKMDSLGKEILRIAFPSALAVAADPVASLIDTAFIGHLGPVELAAAGVSIALFNQASKITILPLVGITTSFVAEEDTIEKIRNTAVENHGTENNMAKSREVVLLEDIENSAAKEYSDTNQHMAKRSEHESANANMCKFSSFGSSSEKSMSKVERKKRQIASASTALLFGTTLGLIQTAILTFAATPLLSLMGQKHDMPSQILAVKYLRLRALGAPAVLLSLAIQGIFRGFKDTKTPLYVIGGVLLAKVVALTFCVTLASSLAARLGPIHMAAFQTCLQVWLASSLLADGLAVSVQAILACSFAEKDYGKVTAAATRTLQMSFVLGVGLSVVGVGLYFGAGTFSNNVHVKHIIRMGAPFVAVTQPINSLAFVLDGVNYGVSDFAYSAYSMASWRAFYTFLFWPFSKHIVIYSNLLSKFPCTFSGHGFISNNCITVPSLQKQWIHWDMDCTKHFYDSSHVGRNMQMYNAYAGWDQEQDRGVSSEATHCRDDMKLSSFHC
ncbi:unnamed protein product [Sphenostylis stenocarpa]|uniref:Protein DETOXIFICATION n=1 Tax=Sphenostylis stenocarpa TaxID=92480 RepID=A0AA86VWS8_9FABA|nr:unnamed protein product [Sphenostylis stenocarpa]